MYALGFYIIRLPWRNVHIRVVDVRLMFQLEPYLVIQVGTECKGGRGVCVAMYVEGWVFRTRVLSVCARVVPGTTPDRKCKQKTQPLLFVVLPIPPPSGLCRRLLLFLKGSSGASTRLEIPSYYLPLCLKLCSYR